MKNLYLQIKQDQLIARKNRNKVAADTLSVLLASADSNLISRKSEEEQHEFMVKLVIYYDKTLSKNIELFGSKPELVEKYKAEREVISVYLPKQLTQDEIQAIITEQALKTLPDTMKYLSANFKGRFDAKLVKSFFS